MHVLNRLGAGIFGASSILALALLGGRLSGLAREIVLAERFGASRSADIAFVLLALPDLLVNLLLSGGLSAALVPRLKALTTTEGARLFIETCGAAALLTAILAVALTIWPDAIFAFFAPGLIEEGKTVIQSVTALLIAASIPLVALSGIVAAYHAADERYFVSGLGTLIFNLVLIGVLLQTNNGDLQVLAVAICAGAGVRLAAQMTALPRHTWHPATRPVLDAKYVTAFVAGIAASAFAVAPPTLMRSAASLLGTGNVAMFNYAQKLVELPLGILIASIGTVALTRLSEQFAVGDMQAAQRELAASLRLTLMLAALVVTLGAVLARPVVSVLFFRGAMTLDQIDQIAQLTRIALLSVPFVGVTTLATAALNAQGKINRVLRGAGLALVGLVLLMVPGLALSSAPALMAAAVGSQALLALYLAHYARISFWGSRNFADKSWYASVAPALIIAHCIAIPFYYYFKDNDILVIFSGGFGFIAGVAFYFRLFKWH